MHTKYGPIKYNISSQYIKHRTIFKPNLYKKGGEKSAQAALIYPIKISSGDSYKLY